MFVSKKKYLESKAAHARDVAALEIEIREKSALAASQSIAALRERVLRIDAENALATALAATEVVVRNADARTREAESVLERHLRDFVGKAVS